MQGMLDPKFLKRLSGTMICLTCAILCHSLRALQPGVYKKPPNFNPEGVGGGRVRIIACFLITESTNREKRKIFLSGRRTTGGVRPGNGGHVYIKPSSEDRTEARETA